MSGLIHHRCVQHQDREAVARCPSCRQFFCRECVTEHEDQFICATCLRQRASNVVPAARGAQAWWMTVSAVAGMSLLVLLFYVLGVGWSKLPNSFHQDADPDEPGQGVR
jgi:hypothetical protein